MRILFLGNCHAWRAVHKLKHILPVVSQFGNEKLTFCCLYMAKIKIHNYTEYFDTRLTETLPFNNNKNNTNILFTYKTGYEGFYKTYMPDTSIGDILEEGWDVVVVCGHTGNASAWIYDKYEKWYKSCFEKIREHTDAKIYWLWGYVPGINHELTHSCDTDLYTYGGELAVANSEKEMYEYLNKVDDRICRENGVNPLKLRVAYEKLIEKFPDHQRLMVDGIHPDCGIGEYFSAGFIYKTFLEDLFGIDLKRINMNLDVSSFICDIIKEPCISINKETKRIADSILDEYFGT